MPDTRPYSPSWIDRTLDWIDSLPIAGLPFFLILYLLLGLSMHSALWLEGLLPFGEVDSTMLFDMIWIPYGLGYLYLLKRAARGSIEQYHHVLEISDADFDSIAYRFITMPALPVLGLSALGLIGGITVGIGTEFSYQAAAGSTSSHVVWSVLSGGGYTFFPIVFYAALRHLRQISELYGRVERISLFNLQSLYGLSRVTMIVGAFMVINVNMNYVWETFLGTRTQSLDQMIGLSVAILVAALVVVVTPLWGIHRKIGNEKRKMLMEIAQQIEALHLALQDNLKAREYQNIQSIDRGLNTLFTMRNNIQAIPAWPWNPSTFRNFASAIMLPLLIWLAQRLLSQFF